MLVGMIGKLGRYLNTPRRRAAAAGLLVVLVALIALGLRLILGGRDGGLAQIEANGVWRVGMDPSFPPFEDLDSATGQPVGFDVDLARAIASRWGVRVEIVPMGFDQLIDAVAARRIDAAISAIPIAEERTREVSFSAAYLDAGLYLAAAPGSPITGTVSLKGRRLAAEWGSEGDAQARELQKADGGAIALVLKESANDALAAVAAGEADAAVVDAVSLALFQRGGGRLVVIGPTLQSQPYAIVLAPRAPNMVAAVDDALAALRKDGTLAQIQARWLSTGVP